MYKNLKQGKGWIYGYSCRLSGEKIPEQLRSRGNMNVARILGPCFPWVLSFVWWYAHGIRTKRNLRRFDNFNVGHFDLFSLGLGFFTGWRSPKTDGWCQICIQTVGSILRIKVPNTFTMISNMIELILRDHRNKDQLHPLKRSYQQQQQAQMWITTKKPQPWSNKTINTHIISFKK